MDRTTWTDERLDDLAGEVRELRVEMRTGFEGVNRRIDTQGADLRHEIDALRQTILRVGGGMMVGLVGVIAAVLIRGV